VATLTRVGPYARVKQLPALFMSFGMRYLENKHKIILEQLVSNYK
jgi:hypothetical protein